MTDWFQSLPFYRKLKVLLLLSSSVAIVLLFVAMLVSNIVDMREEVERDTAMVAEMTAVNSQAALTFGDAKSATVTLGALAANPAILAAEIIDAKQQVLARYASPKSSPGLSITDGDHEGFWQLRLRTQRPVWVDGEVVGEVHIVADLSALWSAVRAQVLTLIVISLITLIIVNLIARHVGRLVAAPIEMLSGTAREIARTRDFSRRAAGGSRDEVGVLVSSFNQLIEALEVHTRQLTEYQGTLEAEVARQTSDLRRQTSELLAARDAAESASRAKSEFLSSMSHELRTPLNAILGYSQLMAMDPALPAGVRENAQEIESAGGHLLSLIGDLLDLSRIESGNLELDMGAVGVREVLGDSLRVISPLAARLNVTLIDEVSADETTFVHADFVRLRQVLINLLSNAVKYNRPNGSIRVSGERRGKVFRIGVADTGIGIPVEKQYRLFTAFDRLGNEGGVIEGTGIGLVITRRIVDALGATMGFDSVEGKGSVFWVELPMTAS